MKGIIISCSHRWLAGRQWSRVFLPFLLGMVHAAGVRAGDSSAAQSNTLVTFSFVQGTNALGKIDVELFDQEKPETVRNFLLYVRSGAYSNEIIHRCVPGFIVQGGGFSVADPTSSNQFSAYLQVTNYGRLTNEFLVGPLLSNTLGTLAMAKVADDPNSATSQWFFNLGDNSTNLDTQNGGFTVFGSVLASTNANEGLAVLQYFNTLSTNAGIVNLGTLVGSNYSVFSSLPVAYTNTVTRVPLYGELYYANISVVNDTRHAGSLPPTVSILSPPANSRFTNQTVTVHGAASDDAEVAQVVYQLSDAPPVIASGTTNWQFNLAPAPGFNTVTVNSIDWGGNFSTNATLSFFYEATFPLALQVLGRGTVTGLTNGTYLQAGSSYTANAVPAKDFVFDSWSGSVTSSNATVTFQVPATATNFSLTAKFIPDPLVQLAGTYNGLFQPLLGPGLDGVGSLTLALQTGGTFTGTVLYQGTTAYYAGRFDSSGAASVTGVIGEVNCTLTLQLQETNSGGVITGGFSGASSSTSVVQLERLASALPSSNAPPAGQYTFAITPTTNNPPSPVLPSGNGFGTLSVAAGGTLSLSGVLGDGTAFSCNPKVTQLGQWPIYVTLAQGTGVLLGWLYAPATNPGALTGTLQWVRAADAKANSYPGGFSNVVSFTASPYSPPASGARVLNWVYGQSVLAGTDLDTPITNLVKLTTSNSISVWDANPARLQLSLNLASGRVSGSFVNPWFGYTNLLNGVVLQDARAIRGQYVIGGQTGSLDVDVSPLLVTQSVVNVTLAGLSTALEEGGLLLFETNGTLVFTNQMIPPYNTALDANGHSVVLSGAGVTRLFEVQSNLSFSAQGITFADGFQAGANGANGSPPANGGDGAGGAILNLGGSVSLTNCVMTNCLVRGGDAGLDTVTNAPRASGGRGLGGAICNRGGQLTLQSCLITDNTAAGGRGRLPSVAGISEGGAAGLGGGIFSDGGQCLVLDSTFTGNQARGGAPLPGVQTPGWAGDAAGGALALAGGSLLLSGSSCSSNSASGSVSQLNTAGAGGSYGGALFVESNATATLELAVLSGNSSSAGQCEQTDEPGDALGGGLYSAGALSLTNCTLEQNSAAGGLSYPAGKGLGGGLAAVGSVTINSSTFNGNLAQGGSVSGAGANDSPGAEGLGGGLYALTGAVAITNSTFALNRAAGGAGTPPSPGQAAPYAWGSGGAVALASNTAAILNVTIALNTAVPPSVSSSNTPALAGGVAIFDSATTLWNSIVASNAPANFSGAILDGGCNFSSDASSVFTATNSVINVDPMLGSLTTNGGPTLTMALLPLSPARDVVLANYPPVDQRGVPRPQGPAADSGAFEYVPTLPVFTLQPSGTNSVRAGSSFALQALAEGAGPIGYLWSKDGALVAGASSNVLTLTNVQASDAGLYAAIATNSFGATTSTVEVVSVDLRPYIVTQPQDATVAPNGSASFTVSAAGPSLSFLWLHNDLPISSATNAVVTISEAAPGDQGTYQVIITNYAGAVTSQVVTLTFDSAALAILSQPQSLTVAEGQACSLSVLATGLLPISYQWLLGNVALAGQTNQVLSFAQAAQTNAGTYSVVVTNAYLAVTSAPATLVVVRAPSLSIAVQGTNLLLTCYGDPLQVRRLLGTPTLAALANWMPLATNTSSGSGEVFWTLPAPTNRAFYFRAVTP